MIYKLFNGDTIETQSNGSISWVGTVAHEIRHVTYKTLRKHNIPDTIGNIETIIEGCIIALECIIAKKVQEKIENGGII
jgi:hypothetical protein